MTPSVETRLKAIAGALEHLIIPALAAADADPIVQEQASLSLGHLQVIARQMPCLDRYHDICLREQLRTGRELLACAAGGEVTRTATIELASALKLAQADLSDRSLAKDGRNRVAGAISQLVIASSHDGDPAFIRLSQDILISHGERQSARDRAWYGPTGLDPFAASLPSIEELIKHEEAAIAAMERA